MMFTLNRDYVHVTKDGPSFGFRKGVPLNVPAEYAADVIALGAEASVADADEAKEVLANVAKEQAYDRARIEKIKAAVETMVKRNRSGDFSGGGKPSKNKVEALAGVGGVSEKEIATAFAEVQEAIKQGVHDAKVLRAEKAEQEKA